MSSVAAMQPRVLISIKSTWITAGGYHSISLFNAARNDVKNNGTFKSYYDKKRAEGKSHYNALGH